MKRSPWFPVWAGFQDDEPFLAVSAEAELLYLRAVARCKQQGQGRAGGHIGRQQLRRLADKMVAGPDDLAAELVAIGLWVDGGGGWQIPAYGGWNTSADDEAAEAAANGRRGNHARWKHPGPFETCGKCHRVNENAAPNVSPDESPPIAPRSPPDSSTDRPPTPETSLDRDQTETETRPPLPPRGHFTAGDADVVELADAAVQAATLDPTALATDTDRHLVAAALDTGHGTADITAAAAAAADNGRRPREYLRAILRRLGEEPPARPPRPQPPAERRGALDDERAPCTTCHSTRFIDGPGGLEHCPDCITART